MPELPTAVVVLGERLQGLGWVTDLWVAGSLATGDYVPEVSDIDLVAVVDRQLDDARQALLVQLHRQLDQSVAAGTDLGCVYVEDGRASEPSALHPTWTHGVLVQRILSGRTGQLLSKTRAIEQAQAPVWLKADMAARRRGASVKSPRVRTAWIAWRDARATVKSATCGGRARRAGR